MRISGDRLLPDGAKEVPTRSDKVNFAEPNVTPVSVRRIDLAIQRRQDKSRKRLSRRKGKETQGYVQEQVAEHGGDPDTVHGSVGQARGGVGHQLW